MATTISVTSKLTVPALLAINNAEFKHWYELGVWWAMYGDGQGSGLPAWDISLADLKSLNAG